MQFDISQFAIIAVCLLISVSFHEAMHAFTAHWLGDSTASDLGRITLNPFKHLDIYMSLILPLALLLFGLQPIFVAKPVPFNPLRVKYDEFGAALVGLAGPLTNLCLATVSAGILRIVASSNGLTEVLLIFTHINVALFVFNMIPLPPLDGSRLLYAVAPEPLQRFMQQIESMGFLVLILLLVVLAPVIGPLIGFLSDGLLRLLLGRLILV